MKTTIFAAILLACFSCKKGESNTPPPSKNVEKKEKLVEKKTEPSLEARMDNIHSLLRANKKILAIKEYRKSYKFPLHACKQAIEIEQTKLGLPSVDKVHRLVWNGKELEARNHLRKAFPSLTDDSAKVKLEGMKKRVGEATEANLNAHIKNGKLGPALMVYRHLNPDVEMPEMYKIVSAKMPKTAKY